MKSEDITGGLDLLGDWLDAKGYTEEAGLCTRAMDEINRLRDKNIEYEQAMMALQLLQRAEADVKLRAENEKLRAALAPFVDAGHFKVVTNVGTTEEYNQVSISVRENKLRAAAAALKETGDEYWDIVKALRHRAEMQTATGITEPSEHIDWMAADEIEKLRAALKDTLEYAERLESRLDSHDLAMCEDTEVKSAARAAYLGEKDD